MDEEDKMKNEELLDIAWSIIKHQRGVECHISEDGTCLVFFHTSTGLLIGDKERRVAAIRASPDSWAWTDGRRWNVESYDTSVRPLKAKTDRRTRLSERQIIHGGAMK